MKKTVTTTLSIALLATTFLTSCDKKETKIPAKVSKDMVFNTTISEVRLGDGVPLNIDVILMDIQMPKMNGVLTTKEITRLFPQIKVIMLTVLDSEQTIYEAVQAGAIGYLVKESSPQELYDSIHQTLAGGASMSPTIMAKAMRIIQNPDALSDDRPDFGLSNRELDVLKQLSTGLNYNQIASNLIISPNTVRRHIENVYKKLGCTIKQRPFNLPIGTKWCRIFTLDLL